MKKIGYLLITIMVVILMGSCTTVKELMCKHEYQTSTINATCAKEGKTVKKCDKCGKTVETIIPKTIHHFTTSSQPSTCTIEGFIKNTCNDCGYVEESVMPLLDHQYSEWHIDKVATELEDGIETRSCANCGVVDIKTIPSMSYIDLDVIKFDFDPHQAYTFNNLKDFQVFFDACVLNEVKSITSTINFAYDNLDQLLDDLTFNSQIEKKYELNCTMTGNKITLNFNFPAAPLYKASENNLYAQVNSLNVLPYTQIRTETYDDFLKNATYKYTISTSEQLVYCLERRVYPEVIANSEAELVLDEAKKILRSICDDSMTQVEKVKAIHDYLVMNVTYDKALYDKLFTNPSNISSYRGFYLEGAIIDKRAVCEGIAKAFVVLANLENIPCVLVSGKSATNPTGPGHAWNKICVDGTWYIIDATSDGVILNETKEVLTYECFLVDEVTYSSKYIGTNFVNIKCEKKYNIYDLMKYEESGNEFSLDIKNIEQLKQVIKYMKQYSLHNVSFQFNLSYSTDPTKEVNKALTQLGIVVSYKYMTSGSIFTFLFD